MSDHEDGQAVPETQKPKKKQTEDQSRIWMDALLQEPNTSSSPILELNVEDYLSDIEEFDMTEDQKIELLQTLWNMMAQFVALGFKLEAPDKASKNCAQGALVIWNCN